MSIKRKYFAVAGLLLFLFIFAGCGQDDGVSGTKPEDEPFHRTYIRLYDTDYYWNHVIAGVSAEEYELPEGFVSVGKIKEYTQEELTDNLQMHVEFPIKAEVYAKDAASERIYVRAATDWLEDNYIVFVKRETETTE